MLLDFRESVEPDNLVFFFFRIRFAGLLKYAELNLTDFLVNLKFLNLLMSELLALLPFLQKLLRQVWLL